MISLCELLDQLHASGNSHGDFTLHNAMWDENDKPVFIDLAASGSIALGNPEGTQAATDDDFAEP
jgi:tRNA A-37 threonylcarbamoyl transferase component Bud32